MNGENTVVNIRSTKYNLHNLHRVDAQLSQEKVVILEPFCFVLGNLRRCMVTEFALVCNT